MRLSTLRLMAFCLLAAAACTTDQDLGNHADGGAGDGDGDTNSNDGPKKGDGSHASSGDGDQVTDPPLNNGDGDNNSFEHGTAETFAVTTAGALAFSTGVSEYGVSLTTMSGTDGCALIGSQEAAPGTQAARVLVHVEPKGDDRLCPDGIYSIKNNPSDCQLSFDQENGLPPGCALYERWNKQGALEARVLGVGGSMSVKAMEDTTVGTGHFFCHVELTVRLPGGISVSDKFDYDYYTQAGEDTFCAQ